MLNEVVKLIWELSDKLTFLLSTPKAPILEITPAGTVVVVGVVDGVDVAVGVGVTVVVPPPPPLGLPVVPPAPLHWLF